MPLGAPILWPESVRRVQGRSVRQTGSLPNAWTASVWNGTPAARHRAAISATGWITPTSLFTHITDTTAGRSASAPSSASRSTRPVGSTGSTTSRPPRCAYGVGGGEDRLVLDGALTTAHMAAPRARAARAAPTTPRLSASVPPEVKITWLGSAPTAARPPRAGPARGRPGPRGRNGGRSRGSRNPAR